MKETDRAFATGLVVLMLILLFGSALHVSPRFAGSFWGGVLAVVGALLMLVPLVYTVIKRSRWLKTRATKTFPMKVLLTWHVYAGIVGPILVLLHTGHRFESPLGIALTALTIVVVLSGFVGRYLMSQFSKGIREKKAMLTELQGAYSHARAELAENPAPAEWGQPFSGLVSRLIGSFFLADDAAVGASPTSASTLLRVTESMAEVEYSIAMQEKVKSWFGKWLKWHLVISFVLYGLLALHVWGAVHFGLRWFDSWTPSTLSRDPVAVASPVKADEFSTHFGRVFGRYWRPRVVVNGIRTTVFDYSAMAAAARQPTSDFSRATEALKQADPYRFNMADEAKAFWLNVYNFGAMTIATANYPIDSITDRKVSAAGDPWALEIVNVGGRDYSLREIEKEILLPQFGDPRIVFAVSCAAVSCPDRSAAIFSGETLDTQLDAMIREFLRNPEKGLLLDRASNVLTLSWILKADNELFGDGQRDGILEFVGRYAAEDVVTWIRENRNEIKIEFFEHDWTLNDSAQAE